MSTIVFQEFKSCYESQVTEPRSLSLKLNPPKLDFSQYLEVPKRTSLSDSNTGAWSCILGLSHSSSSNGVTENKEKPKGYGPPVLALSEKSLEMCTENLGSETGSDISEFSVFSSTTSVENLESPMTGEIRKSCRKVEIKRANRLDFPPPLTTISGSSSIRVKPHRESGRLVIKAFSAPVRHSCIRAERSDGRLRLSIFRDCSSDIDSEEDEEEQQQGQEQEEEEVISDSEVEENDEYEYQLNKEDVEEEEEVKVEEEEGGEDGENVEDEEGEQEEESDEIGLGRDTEGINWDVGVKMGMGEFQRPSRCKEGGRRTKRLINWEAFWVATS